MNKEYITAELQQAIIAYLQQGVRSARIISELLIKEHGARADTFSHTGKRLIFVQVAIYLESLASKNLCTLVEANSEDRKSTRDP